MPIVMKTNNEIRRDHGIRVLNRDAIASIRSHYQGMRLGAGDFRVLLDRAFEWDTAPEGHHFWSEVSRTPGTWLFPDPRGGGLLDVRDLLNRYFTKDLGVASLNPLMVDLSRYNTDDDE